LPDLGPQDKPYFSNALTGQRRRAFIRRCPTPENMTMADLKAKFEQATKDIKALKEKPDNETLLKLYALYKQGAEGDVKGEKPGFFDFVGTAKYEAWGKLAGTKPDDAMKKYIDLVKKLVG
jgi:acyl-CoA-binding protein